MIGCRYRTVVLSLLALAAGAAHSKAAGSSAAESPQPLSPGAADRMVEITETCPTFSWAELRSSQALKVVVLDVSERDTVALTASLPGGARSWTPSAEQCLEPGHDYRWYVIEDDGRTVDARGHTFSISHLPSEAATAWARDVLQRHLDHAVATPPADLAPAPAANLARISDEDGDEAAVESNFSGEAAVEIAGPMHVVGVRAVNTGSGGGHVVADGPIVSQSSPIVGNGMVFTDSSGNTQVVLSPPDLNRDLYIEGWLIADRLEATTKVGATAVQVPSGSLTGDDGGGGVEYVDQKNCGILGLNDCIRVDEHDTFCFGGSFVVAARLWQTDDDQIGLQVKCTDPFPLSNP